MLGPRDVCVWNVFHHDLLKRLRDRLDRLPCIAKQERLLVSDDLGCILCVAFAVSFEYQTKMVCGCSIGNFLVGGYFVLWKYTAQTKDYFCLLNCGNFYLFFMLGVFTTKYRLLEKAKKANWMLSACIVLYVVLFCVDMPIHALDSLNRHIFMPFCMVFVIVTLFMARHGETSRFERILDYVGKRTLDVYVLHYFFISVVHLQDVGKYMEESGNSLLMFILAVGLATVITALSVGVGNVLHKGQLIEKLVYGK